MGSCVDQVPTYMVLGGLVWTKSPHTRGHVWTKSPHTWSWGALCGPSPHIHGVMCGPSPHIHGVMCGPRPHIHGLGGLVWTKSPRDTSHVRSTCPLDSIGHDMKIGVTTMSISSRPMTSHNFSTYCNICSTSRT